MFRGDNLRAQAITAPEWVLSGPAETGKTFAALWRLYTEAQRWPGSQWALIRKSRATMDGTVLSTWRRILGMRGDVAAYGGERPSWYDFPNGARVWVGGLDNPDKILSGERDGIYINQAEELTENDWETLTTRATGRGAVTDTPMVWADCNPGPADHWIKRRAERGRLELLVSRHEDNPSLHDGADWTDQGRRTRATLEALTGARKLRLCNGLWVGVEGQFFTAWDEARHVVDPFPIPEDWPIWAGFDYGYAHNTAFILLTAGDGVVYQIGEHVAHRWLIPQHADAIGALLDRLGIKRGRLREIAAGQDCFIARGDADGLTIAERYAQHGIRLQPAQVARVTGAGELVSRLGNPEADPPLPPTLRIFRTCVRTIATIPAMPTDPNNPEDVLKTDADQEGRGGDDPYDALRYGLMARRRAAGAAPSPFKPQKRPRYVPGKGLVS